MKQIIGLPLIGGLTFLLGVFLVFCTRFLALRISFTDNPDGKLKMHRSPVAYGGGVAIFLTVVLMGWMVSITTTSSVATVMLAGASVLLVIGLCDDARVLSPAQKFAGQALIAWGTAFLLPAPDFLPTGIVEIGYRLLTGFFIASLINGFNLVDVMDGLAGTLAFGALIMQLLCASFIAPELMPFFLTSAAAIAAFLLFNRPSASIYLGDAGSQVIGYVLASWQVLIAQQAVPTYSFLGALIILGMPFVIPACELFSLIAIRSWKGLPFYHGSPDHFCHLLQRRQFSVVQILMIVALLILSQILILAMFLSRTLPIPLVVGGGISFATIWAILAINELSRSLKNA